MGRFITFEGVEGSGKTTHIEILRARLERLGFEVVTVREPGGTLLGESVRGLLQFDTAGEPPCTEAELLLFCASRAQLVDKVVRPALAKGIWVISDRFSDSTYAYQGFGRGFDLCTLRRLNSFATGGLVPDLTILLDVDGATRRSRLLARNGQAINADRFEREPEEFHEKVAGGFRCLAAEAPERFEVLEGMDDIPTVGARIWDAVTRRLDVKAT